MWGAQLALLPASSQDIKNPVSSPLRHLSPIRFKAANCSGRCNLPTGGPLISSDVRRDSEAAARSLFHSANCSQKNTCCLIFISEIVCVLFSPEAGGSGNGSVQVLEENKTSIILPTAETSQSRLKNNTLEASHPPPCTWGPSRAPCKRSGQHEGLARVHKCLGTTRDPRGCFLVRVSPHSQFSCLCLLSAGIACLRVPSQSA